MNNRKLSILTSRHTLSKSDIIPLIVITVIFLGLGIANLGHTNTVDVMLELESSSENRNHMNSLYFDEIYFVRTATEHIENINPYEVSHPPLGKNIIAASILLFGSSPLGWRILGAVCGVLMIVVMYIFVKNLFGKTSIAVCTSLILGFDFLRFTQSRIGTIDTFAVLFILLAYFFMYRHITTDRDALFRKSLPSLALSGFFFGLSFAVKWVGFYAGAGLLVIYIIRLVQLGTYYIDTEKRGFGKYLIKTLTFSLLFFIIVPVIVYYVNYIPYGTARGMRIENGMLWSAEYFNMVVSNQEVMFKYHYYLDATHGGSSVWWQWIFDVKPIWFVNNHRDGLRASFGTFGNPVVYWGGILAIITMLIRVFTHRDGKALFILIGYLSQLLPWLAVSRVMFAYHYFPSSMFIILALAHIFNTMFERAKAGYKGYVYGFTTVSGTAFAMFFPGLAGMYMPQWYYSIFCKWLPTWPY